MRRETGATSHPKLCNSIRLLQQDVEYTAGKYRDIARRAHWDRNRARRERKQAENKERLKLAKEFKEDSPANFFTEMKKFTKLFG